jgi:aspartyl-tRNA(Asn)/glutamyl-tRNA(Gln) amidotransferase subunit B
MKYRTVIGLEIHAELNTASKVFCSCDTAFGQQSNTAVCPFCVGMPGTLPSLNQRAVELAVKAGLAFGCDIQETSSFDRKNYYYPDLPKAYQITQFFSPIALNGSLEIMGEIIPIERIHIEEDAGKLYHKGESTLADYNRSSVPLIEIVTAPKITSAKMARAFAERVARVLSYIEVCDCKMEQGSLRVDVNVSVCEEDSDTLGTRTEIKNLNSFRAVEHAIDAEAKRQIEILENGGKILMQTLHFDDVKEALTILRTKEEKVDYRYFPEPDIPEIILSKEYIENIQRSLPSLPDQVERKLIEEYSLTEETAYQIAEKRCVAELFEAAAIGTENIKTLTSLFITELPRIKKVYSGKPCLLEAEEIAKLCNLVEDRKVNNNSAKEIFEEMFLTGRKAVEVAEEKGFLITISKNDIEIVVEEVIESNPNAVKQFITGSQKVFGFLMGQVSKKLNGAADPVIVRYALETKLNKLK